MQSGAEDIARAAQALAREIPALLAPLAEVAYDYGWVWHADGERLFRTLDEHRWRLCRQNPVRLLREASQEVLERAAGQESIVQRAHKLHDDLAHELARPARGDGVASRERPIAFFCAEFGVHRSLPIYSGGLGVLAGDILKEASDRALPLVGVGLMYRLGFFHQRVDASGWQHEYWYDMDPERRPCVLVTAEGGGPLCIELRVWDETVVAQIWRVNVGRVPLFLLDTELPENSPRARFITARLYEGNREVRLAQYALLGIGGLRALDALGIEPGVVHMNEGHPAAATLELLGRRLAEGATLAAAHEEVRGKVVFTTHTPVPAGNETYSKSEFLQVFGNPLPALPEGAEYCLRLGRLDPDQREQPIGMTALALRMSRSTNGVSRIHGEVSRRMWRPLFGAATANEVPISHVTNGAHVASWIAPSMRALLDRYLPRGWLDHDRVSDPDVWQAVERIPDEELWAVRTATTRRLAQWVRSRTVTDRLTRGDSMDYAMKAARSFDPDALTLGFARRLATYKRLYLVIRDRERFLRLLSGPRPIQWLFAGKAHPRDDDGKRIVVQWFELKSDPRTGGRVVFIEDYDIGLANILTAGCDVWVNLPRPPLEASGTSGMKAAFNGTLNLSVLDGWWAEAYDGSNGWAIDGSEDADHEAKDRRDALAFYELLEREVIPMFYQRDADGIPRAWVARMKASLRTIGPRFCAARMLDDYVRTVYAAAGEEPPAHRRAKAAR